LKYTGPVSLAVAALAAVLTGTEAPAGPQPPQPATAWADWIEPGFPFFSSVLDARRAGPGFPAGNLTPRALVLRVGRDHWAGFDLDLLRVAAIWRGNGVTATALAPGSYKRPDRKTPPGQNALPEPDGEVWLASGIYPGWQVGERPSFEDPREPAPSPEEVGRGPLAEEAGRFTAIRQVRDGVVLEYTAGGADVRERLAVSETGSGWTFVRHFRVGASSRQLWLVLGSKPADIGLAIDGGAAADVSLERYPDTLQEAASPLWVVRVPPRQKALEFSAAFTSNPAPPPAPSVSVSADPPDRRWPQEVTSSIRRSTAGDAYVVDDIELPLGNPWRRNVRPGDVQFRADGTGLVVTIDGDVWSIRGLHDPGGIVHWRRFASGLHEPFTLAIRDEQIYVFDRNGIWRLRDTNADGEADVHELFSNAFAQTADTREFPNTLRLAPGGEFVIAKGGQEATTLGKHNGSVLRISADGRRATILGYGFRQPNIGVNIRTGLVTASDQQGHYIPSTPLHIVRDGQFYGFLSDRRPREVYPAPIAEPLTWVPHTANASAISQVWLFGARMGPLEDGLVQISFNRPELFRVLLNHRTATPQAAVVSITRAFEFPPLNGSVNPADGQLYLAGFQIAGWGTTATRLAGLGRVRYTGAASTLPREIVPMDRGVLLRFESALDPARAVNPDNYSLASWHYKRTYQYGSPQLKTDGTPGIDPLAPSSAYLSSDRLSVFVGVPGMQPVMQMRIGWSLATAAGAAFQDAAYFTPYELPAFNPRAEGFGELTVNLSPRAAGISASAPVSADEGRRLYQAYGCIACHAVDATSLTRLGPTWRDLYGAERTVAGGVLRVIADDAYLRESILQPAAKLVTGYERGEVSMPSYAGVLTDAQVDSIVLFIKSLKRAP
jgi:glucose/arabinose dehydrogenase/mono/diheme cytochrome c family protein